MASPPFQCANGLRDRRTAAVGRLPLKRAFDFLARELELTEAERRLVLGNDPDAASLRAREFVAIGAALITLLPDEGRAARWLRAPNDWLNGGIAADLLLSSRIDDLRKLRQYLKAQTV